MSSSSRMLLRLILIAGPAVLAASVGVCYQALRITGRPQEFRSMGKLVMNAQVAGQNSGMKEAALDVTSIEMLESAEMRRRAQERVKALNPEVKVCDMDVRAVQTKGSAIINLLATGNEPKYTRLFLDALIDEFIAFRHALRESSQTQGGTAADRDFIAVMERASPASENVEDWRMPVALGAGGGALLGGLVGFLLSLFLVRPPAPQPPAAG